MAKPSARSSCVNRATRPTTSPAAGGCVTSAAARRRARERGDGTLLVLADLEHGAERRAQPLAGEIVESEHPERLRQIERLADAGRLLQAQFAQTLDRGRDLVRQALAHLRHPGAEDRQLALMVGIVDPVVETAPLQGV